jgi:hypothetical protein
VERLVPTAAGKPRTPGALDAIQIAHSGIIGGLDDMGAKFRTTIKDLKASQRFRQKQNPLHKFNKPSGNQPTKKKEKK